MIGRVCGHVADDSLGVAGGTDDVAQRLHRRAAVDVADDEVIGVRPDELLERRRRAAVGERTARGKVRQQHELVRVEDLGGLRHEVDAAEHDDVRVGARGRLRERQAVADDVGDVLDVGLLVEVGQDDGVQLAFEARDPGKQIERRIQNLGFLCHARYRERHAGCRPPSVDCTSGSPRRGVESPYEAGRQKLKHGDGHHIQGDPVALRLRPGPRIELPAESRGRNRRQPSDAWL